MITFLQFLLFLIFISATREGKAAGWHLNQRENSKSKKKVKEFRREN